MSVQKDELFGPVLSVVLRNSCQEALDLAHSHEFAFKVCRVDPQFLKHRSGGSILRLDSSKNEVLRTWLVTLISFLREVLGCLHQCG